MKRAFAGLCFIAFLAIGGIAVADQPPDIDADVLFEACRQKGLEGAGATGAPSAENLAKRGQCLEDEIAALGEVFYNSALNPDDIRDELRKAARAIADLYGVIEKTQPACRPNCEAELVYIAPMVDILEDMLREMIDLRRDMDSWDKFVNTWPEPFDYRAVIADCRVKTEEARNSSNRPEAYQGLVDQAHCLEDIIVEKTREIRTGWKPERSDEEIRQRLRDIAIAQADLYDYVNRKTDECVPYCGHFAYLPDAIVAYEMVITNIAATLLSNP